MKAKIKAKPTLSDKIADALTVKPRPDIEEDIIFGTKPKTVKKSDFSSSDSDDEAAISAFRKSTAKQLSEISKKYEGEVVSRKNLQSTLDSDADKTEEEPEESDSEDFQSDLDENNTAEKSRVDLSSDSDRESTLKKHKPDIQENDSEENESDENDSTISDDDESNSGSEDDNDDEGEGYDISQMNEPVKETFEHVKKKNVSEEVKKGSCVRNQLQIWENLLEVRIHLQRCTNTANKMPLPDTFKELKRNDDFSSACNNAKGAVSEVLDKLLTLQELLFSKNPETKNVIDNKAPQSKPVESDEEIPSDTDEEEIVEEKPQTAENKETKPSRKRKLGEYEQEISKKHKSFKPFRDTTITKWNEKTRLMSNLHKNQSNNSILQQIEYLLNDRNKLVKRTQLKRAEYDIVGYNKEVNDQITTSDRKDADEYISEIFDDSDFYHQLLRELIECKSADVTDPVQLSRQWIALQQMRSKMKRKVDTKATKGRRIKYVVHNKLINFMAPQKCMDWTDEMRNELFSSLFGKMFEHQVVNTVSEKKE